MKKIMFVTLFNSALNDKDEYRLMNIAETDLKGSVAIGGSEELKALIRERFEDLFNGDILEYFDSVDVTDEDVDYCINELAIGHASNIAGEDFYWGDAEELISDIKKPEQLYKCAECGSTDIEFRRWYNPNTGDLGVDCEDDECWCNHCQEHHSVDVYDLDELETFDGKLGVRFVYGSRVYEEVIMPESAESDPELDNMWNIRLHPEDSDDVTFVLIGHYIDGDKLATSAPLMIRVEDATEGENYIDDIDII